RGFCYALTQFSYGIETSLFRLNFVKICGEMSSDSRCSAKQKISLRNVTRK
ncbi:hypothetical protein TNCV_1410601, partial [Trichonephila clavipes]